MKSVYRHMAGMTQVGQHYLASAWVSGVLVGLSVALGCVCGRELSV